MGVMARKRRGPTLLELIREPPPGGAFRMHSGGAHVNGDSSAAPGPTASPRGFAPSSGGLSWWQMGARTLRIPVGYVIVAAGLALALAVVGYLVGYSRAVAGVKAERAREMQAQLQMVDPLNSPAQTAIPAGNIEQAQRPPAQQPEQRQAPPPASPQQQASRPPSNAGVPPADLERDPRVAGLNYWVVARLGPDEARRAASFLLANGVRAAVVETNTDRFREVIVSEGFEGSPNAPQPAAIKARVLELGRLYRVQEKGPTDFSDMYARKFSGR